MTWKLVYFLTVNTALLSVLTHLTYYFRGLGWCRIGRGTYWKAKKKNRSELLWRSVKSEKTEARPPPHDPSELDAPGGFKSWRAERWTHGQRSSSDTHNFNWEEELRAHHRPWAPHAAWDFIWRFYSLFCAMHRKVTLNATV